MGNNLTPDGARIKALRIQRGWTQEQLAEIAGISTRTIQRAERANAAAFETVRAVAGAFETDFDQLLKTEARDTSRSEHPRIQPAPSSSSDSEAVAPIPEVRPKLPVRRAWPMYTIAASALAVGLIAGVNLTSLLNRPAALPSAAASSNDTAVPRARASGESSVPAAGSMQAALVPGGIPDPAFRAAKPPGESKIKHRKAEDPGAAGLAPATTSSMDGASQASLQWTPHPAYLELPPESGDVFTTHAIPDIAPASGVLSASAAEPNDEGQDPGAVRQALGQAAKKTGSFVSRVGTSLKRAF